MFKRIFSVEKRKYICDLCAQRYSYLGMHDDKKVLYTFCFFCYLQGAEDVPELLALMQARREFYNNLPLG